jgi:hypothetical protein
MLGVWEEALVDAVLAVAFYDVSGLILEVMKRFVDVTGYLQSSLLGHEEVRVQLFGAIFVSYWQLFEPIIRCKGSSCF